MPSDRKIQLARSIDRLIIDWLRKTDQVEAKPKDVMPLLIKHGVFAQDHREGLPLRKLLRELEASGHLPSVTAAHFEQKKRNKLWYFSLTTRRDIPSSKPPKPKKVLTLHRDHTATKKSATEDYRTTVRWRGRQVETLRDIVDTGLRALFVGINPSPVSVAAGHYHQGRLGKLFWRLLVDYRILPPPASAQFHDELLLQNGFGITDLIKVPTSRADLLALEDVNEGRRLLRERISALRPRVVCCIYKRVLQELCEIKLTNRWGLIDETFDGSLLFALPFPTNPRTSCGRI